MSKEAVNKALLEIGRIIVLALVAWLLAGGIEILMGTFDMPPETKIQITAILLLILKGIDKWLHEKGKEDKNDKLVKGITRF